ASKLGGGNTAPTYWYHDTFYPDSFLTVHSQQLALQAVGGTTQHNYYRNCIFASRATSATIPISGVGVPDSARYRTNEFNYDVVYTQSGTNVATWTGTNFTIVTLRSTLVWEKNGGGTTWNGASGQRFIKPSTYNFRLARNVINEKDIGVRITGVNTAFGTNLYSAFPGSSPPGAPDVGAYEFSNKRRRPWWRRWYQHS